MTEYDWSSRVHAPKHTFRHKVHIEYHNHGLASAQCGDCSWHNSYDNSWQVDFVSKEHEQLEWPILHRTYVSMNLMGTWNVECLDIACNYRRRYDQWNVALDAGTQHPHRMRYAKT